MSEGIACKQSLPCKEEVNKRSTVKNLLSSNLQMFRSAQHDIMPQSLADPAGAVAL